LLREIIIQLRTKVSVAVTAPTGIAGLNIGGCTIHSFAGIGLGKEPKEKLAGNILRSKRLYERWTSTKVLIIDESQYFLHDFQEGRSMFLTFDASFHAGCNFI
jgi:ATP-dependent DNA helicase PIF1